MPTLNPLINPSRGTTATTTATSDPNNFLNSILPNLPSQKSEASSIIDNLLQGTPSPSTVRNAAATFGAQNGLGIGSGVTDRFGYDLYKQEGQKNQQQGIQNLLQMIQGFSSPTLASGAQDIQRTQVNNQQSQFEQQLAQLAKQFGQNLDFSKANSWQYWRPDNPITNYPNQNELKPRSIVDIVSQGR